MTKMRRWYSVPYFFWLVLFVIAPVLLIVYQSFFDMNGNFTFSNYQTYLASGKYLTMTLNSVVYAFFITILTLVISYPTAYFLTKLKHKDLWLLLIILPTWVNLLLKAYAFIGIFGVHGGINNFLSLFGIAPKQILFTDFSFIVVATYIELPFMIMPIFNALEELNPSLDWRKPSDYLGDRDRTAFLGDAKLGNGFDDWRDFDHRHVYRDAPHGGKT